MLKHRSYYSTNSYTKNYMYYFARLLTTLAHTGSNMCYFYVLQLNNVESYCERVEYSLTYESASFNVRYNLVRLVYANRTVGIQSSILCLIIQCVFPKNKVVTFEPLFAFFQICTWFSKQSGLACYSILIYQERTIKRAVTKIETTTVAQFQQE